jgi:hypothetical protein
VGQNNIIHLNGKQYDAITGALLSENRIKATPEKRQAAQAHQTQAHAHQGRALDGVVRAAAGAKPAAPKQHTVARATTAKPVASKALAGKHVDVRRPTSQHVKPHQTERSKTLMRHVVAKPQATMKPAIKKTVPSEMAAKSASDIAKPLEKKLSVTNVDPIRLSHAQHTPKSHHVKRFNHPAHKHGDIIAPSVQSAAIPAAVLSTPPTPTSKPSADSSDIFEAALARATSHHEPKPSRGSHKANRSNRRLVSVMAGVAAFLVIGGFVTYLNMPAIELRVASVKAGFSATLPEYQPTGYALAGGIDSGDNKVTMSFRSGDSSYQVTQTASDWNSQTLLDAYTEAHGAPERTVQRDGRTIYVYDGTRAAWVNAGVRYEVSGNAALTTEDIVSLAASM